MRRHAAIIATVAIASAMLAPVAIASSRWLPDAVQAGGTTHQTQSSCARRALPELQTDLSGTRVDMAERLEGLYESRPGFLALVFGGDSFWIIVDGASSGDWTKTVPSDVKIVPSCVDGRLIDSAKAAVAQTVITPGNYTSVGYNAFTDSVEIISTLDSKLVAASIDSRVATTWGSPGPGASYSPDDLSIVVSSLNSVSRIGRGNDAAPFWGGARIRLPDGSCSTGFYINSATNGTVMVTAGHCGVNGDLVKNGDNTLTVGTLEGRSFPDPDLAAIDGQAYQAKSYSSYDQATSKGIAGAANPALSSTYCQMGYVSLRVCSTYSDLNAQFCDASGCTNGLAFTSQLCLNGPLGAPGDSGAGVYREISDGTLSVRGLVIAGGPIGTGNVCARWDHRWSTIQSRYNATIVTY